MCRLPTACASVAAPVAPENPTRALAGTATGASNTVAPSTRTTRLPAPLTDTSISWVSVRRSGTEVEEDEYKEAAVPPVLIPTKLPDGSPGLRYVSSATATPGR